ncbi:hypothetical protein MNV49_006851 [Pseudohyphozyma bogoriensis]|nr:hypothetical protein MNV49_006851 [Pseudohyphozyma bogoriensis]
MRVPSSSRPSAAHAAVPSPSPSPEGDPFLAQTRDIPLTQRDRQEGYDLDLVHSQPRGLAPSSRPPPAPPIYFGHSDDTAPAQIPASTQGYDSLPAEHRTSADSYVTRKKDEAYGIAGAGGASAGAGQLGSAAEEGGALMGNGAGRARVKPWYLRPRALYTIVALAVIILALAIGLGVGLGKKKKDDSLAAVASPYGTVIPSSYGSLSTTYSAKKSQSTITSSATPTTTTTSTPASATAAAAASAISASGSTVEATVTSSYLTSVITYLSTATYIPTANGTTKASTGNLPIPAGNQTTIISGSSTIVVSSESVLTDVTAKRRLKARETGSTRPRRRTQRA